MITQQVNLYQDQFHEKRLYFSAQQIIPGLVRLGERTGCGRSADTLRLRCAAIRICMVAGGKPLVVSQGRAGRGAVRSG